MAKEISVVEIYQIKSAAEAEINDILKGFTLNTGMAVSGVDVIDIPTAKDAINTYYKTRLEVKL